MPDDAAAPDARHVIADEDEKGQRQNVIDVRRRRLSSSVACPDLSVYCSGSTDSQLEIRMNTKIVTASGSTNGAIRMPMALSICPRIWSVIASQNS